MIPSIPNGVPICLKIPIGNSLPNPALGEKKAMIIAIPGNIISLSLKPRMPRFSAVLYLEI